MKGLLFVGVVSVGIGLANPVNAMKFLTTACEEALALSALPKRLRADASTYVLERNGYRKSRFGRGPFVCVVNRNHPESLIPMCLDRAGTKTILPWTLKRGMMILAGKTNQDYLAARERKVAEGEVPIPPPGLSYMLSDYNYIYFDHAKRVMKVPAHMMYYAPNLTDEDIGGSRQGGIANRGLPFITDPGVHGFMISLVERASDTGGVEQHCDGQLGSPPPGVYD